MASRGQLLRGSRMAGVVAVCAALAACTSSGSSGSSGTAGSHIKVMVIGSFTAGSASAASFVFSTPPKGVKAAAKAMNAAGGMNGHQVDVVTCDDQGNPNLAATCARQAKTDGVVAVVGSFDPVGTAQTLPLLKAEGIPYVGGTSVQPVDYTSSNVWAQDGGGALSSYGLIADVIDSKCTSVSYLAIDTPLTNASWAASKAAFKAAGISYRSNYVQYKAGAVDLSPSVSSVLNQHAQCLIFGSTATDGLKLVQLIRQSNSTVKLFAAYQSVGAGALSGLGSAGNGVNIVSATPLPTTSTPAMVQFRKDMTAAGYAKAEDGFSVTGWAGMQLLAYATKGLKSVTSTALTAKLPTLSNVAVGGYPSVSFTKPFDNKTYPRMFNRKVQYYVTKNGQFISDGTGAHDASAYFRSS